MVSWDERPQRDQEASPRTVAGIGPAQTQAQGTAPNVYLGSHNDRRDPSGHEDAGGHGGVNRDSTEVVLLVILIVALLIIARMLWTG